MDVISFVQVGDVSVGRFRTEEIEANNVVDLKRQLMSMIEEGRRKFVLNFANIRFLYSDVLEMLINFYKNLKSHGGRLVVCGLQPVILEIFTTTRLDVYFDITDDEKAALKRLGASEAGQPSAKTE